MEEPRKPTVKELAALFPLCNMTRDELSLFCEQVAIKTAKKGKTLVELGQSDQKTLFLLRGTVELEDSNGRGNTISDDSPFARNPISFTDPHQHKVICRSPVEYLRVNNSIISNLLDKKSVPPLSTAVVNSQSTESSEVRLLARIKKDLGADRLIIPTLPKVASSVRQAIEKDDSVAHIEKLLQTDPALASMLIKAANSALYRTTTGVGSIQQAILRMGLRTVKFLISSYLMKRLFVSKSPLLRKRMSVLWTHSADVAATSYVLAGKAPNLDPEIALLMGLLHDIGSLPIIAYAERFPDLLEDPNRLEAVIHDCKVEVGRLILEQWKFGAEFVVLVTEVDQWHRHHPGPIDYCDIVLVAQYHMLLINKTTLVLPPLVELPAFKQLGLNSTSAESGIELLVDARRQIIEIRKLLAV